MYDNRVKMKGETQLGLERYRATGLPTGDFLYAVLTNNLLQAFTLADTANEAAMADIVCYCVCNMPHGAWGNADKVAAWIMRGGLQGRDLVHAAETAEGAEA